LALGDMHAATGISATDKQPHAAKAVKTSQG